MTGFMNKKGVHPDLLMVGATQIHSPFPKVRLAELYLNYAEAAVEMGDVAAAMEYVNRVRVRAGIPTVQDAWGSIGITPDQARMRQIVRQERQIELYLEAHNFWDMRRWMLAEDYFNRIPRGANVRGATMADFAQETFLDGREVVGVNAEGVGPRSTSPISHRVFIAPTHYLMPIPDREVNINRNLVQNPGY